MIPSMTRFLAAAALTFAALAGCTSQNDDIPDDLLSDDTVPDPGGIYLGTLDGVPGRTITALVGSNNAGAPFFVAYSDDNSFMIRGSYSSNGDGSGFLMTSASYYDLVTTPAVAPQSMTVTGTFDARHNILGAYSITGGSSGTITLTYQKKLYDPTTSIDSSTTLLAGDWSQFKPNGDRVMTLTLARIDDAKESIGGDTLGPNGCHYAGQAQIIDARYNVYRVDPLSETCGTNPVNSMFGLITLLPADTDTNTPQRLVIATGSDASARLFILQKTLH